VGVACVHVVWGGVSLQLTCLELIVYNLESQKLNGTCVDNRAWSDRPFDMLRSVVILYILLLLSM
jgi:hypothetical protein